MYYILHNLDTIQDFMCKLGIKLGLDQTMYAAIGNYPFFNKTSAHKCYLCAGFTEVFDNFGRSDEDMVYWKSDNFLYVAAYLCGFMPNAHKKSWMVSMY